MIACRMAEGVERSGRLGPEIRAYRKDMSTTDITINEHCIMEDAMEFEKPISRKLEDEEKFFDRVLLITQLLTLDIFGFPQQGYTEMKAEDMSNRLVKLITRYGKEFAEFRAGLPQGSPISVIIANLVMWLKHKVKQGTITAINTKRDDGYFFHVWDTEADRQEDLERLTEGFSDDNGAFYSASTTDTLCENVKNAVKLSGYFSMITKLGRCAPKSVIDFWNIDPNDAALIKGMTFESWAWSFEKDSIIKESMPFRVQFRQTPQYWDNLSIENKTAIKFLEAQHVDLKHLGVKMRTDRPDSSATGRDKCTKALDRLAHMYLKRVDDKTLSILINIFVVSFAQFAVIESNITASDLIKVDRAIINKVRQGFGLASQDMKEIIFLPNKWFGMDIKSFQLTDLEATMRELECCLNGEEPHCQSMRARMQAWTERPKNQGKGKWMNLNKNGLVEGNVRKAATHGFFLRDKRHQFCNILVDIIYRDLMLGELANAKQVYGPLGHLEYKQDTKGVLGMGNPQLLHFSTNSPNFRDLRKFLSNNEKPAADWRRASMWTKKSGKSVNFYGLNQFELADRANEALDRINQDVTNFHLFFEWRGENDGQFKKVDNILDFATTTTSWHCPNKVGNSMSGLNVHRFEAEMFHKLVTNQRVGEREPPPVNGEDKIVECMNIDDLEQLLDEGHTRRDEHGDDISIKEAPQAFLDATQRIRLHPGSIGSKLDTDLLILEWFESKRCPFFLASDGGNLNKKEHGVDRGASAVVLGAPFMSEEETFEHIMDCWMERDPIIFIIRVSLLPTWIGDTHISNMQSEASGFCDLGTLLYRNPPQISILDSNATVFNARAIRDNPNSPIRRQVRGSGVAAGKSFCGKMRRIFQDWNGDALDSIRGKNNQGQWKTLNDIHKQLRSWVEDETRKWRMDYFDDNQKQPIVLVDSHQYNDEGKFSSTTYKSPSPCRFFVRMNEVADKMVMVTLHKHLEHPLAHVESPADICYPPGGFRFWFSIEGKAIDGDTPLTVRRRGQQTFRDRAMKKRCQGHMLRIASKTNITPQIVGRRGALSRILRHLATSHSQSFYRNKSYRDLHKTHGNVQEMDDKLAHRDECLICPLCSHAQNRLRRKGNIRHLHIYCENTHLKKARHALYECLETKLQTLVHHVHMAFLRTGENFQIHQQLNDAVSLLKDDDCNVNPQPPLAPSNITTSAHTLTINEWEHISRADQHCRLAVVARRWPLACKLGFITSRTESDWDEDKTCSADSIYVGVLPVTMTYVIDSIVKRIQERGNYQDNHILQGDYKAIKSSWTKIEALVRENARTMQKVVVAQIQEYHNNLKSIAQTIQVEANTGETQLDAPHVDFHENGNGLQTGEACKGLRCRLNVCNSLFRGTGAKLPPGRSKCGECYSFEKAVSMANEAEAYLTSQIIEHDTVDIVSVTAGLTGLMELSCSRSIERERIYEELLNIPKVREALESPTKTKRCKSEKTTRYSKIVVRAMTLIATTLGIVPSKPQGEPIPTLSREEAIDLRSSGDTDMDSWEYMKARILTGNTRIRIQGVLDATNTPLCREEVILGRVQKGRQLPEKPHSLATALPYRPQGRDENLGSLQNQHNTATAACGASLLSKADILECRSQKMVMRGDASSPLPKKRKDIKGTYPKQSGPQGPCNGRDRKRNKVARHPPASMHKNTSAVELQETRNLTDSPTGATENDAIEVLESGDEGESRHRPGYRTMRGLMNLVALQPSDIATLQAGHLVNDSCIDALADILQQSVNVNDISICHTGFFAALRVYGWGDEAKKFIHPDPDEATRTTSWQAHRFTRGHLKSRLLMIPCNFPRKTKFEAGHWILAIREKCDNGKNKLHVLDSLGKTSGTKLRDIIAHKLVRTPFFPTFPKGTTFDVPHQTESECGARVAKYMEDVTHNYGQQENTTISFIIGNIIQWEKRQGRDELAKCRNQVTRKLQGERRNLGISPPYK